MQFVRFERVRDIAVFRDKRGKLSAWSQHDLEIRIASMKHRRSHCNLSCEMAVLAEMKDGVPR